MILKYIMTAIRCAYSTSFFDKLKYKILLFISYFEMKSFVKHADIHSILRDLLAMSELLEKSYFQTSNWTEFIRTSLQYITYNTISYIYIGKNHTLIKLKRCLFSFKTKDEDYGYYLEGCTYIPEDNKLDFRKLSEEDLVKLTSIDFYVNIANLHLNKETGYRYGLTSIYDTEPPYKIKYKAKSVDDKIIDLSISILRECTFDSVCKIKEYIDTYNINNKEAQ